MLYQQYRDHEKWLRLQRRRGDLQHELERVHKEMMEVRLELQLPQLRQQMRIMREATVSTVSAAKAVAANKKPGGDRGGVEVLWVAGLEGLE